MIDIETFFKDRGLGIQGRTLVALKPFPAGTVLLEQLPLTQVPLPSIRRQRCNYCLRRASLQCCGRCRSAYFCSNTCFRNAWLHYHQTLCEPLEFDTYTNVDVDRWLLERAALTLHSHARLNKHNSHSPPHLKYAIQALEIHPQPDGTAIINNTTPFSTSSSPSSATTRTSSHTTTWLPTTTAGAITTSQPSAPIDFDAVSDMLAPFDCPFTADELATVQEQISLSRFDILDPEQHMDKVGYGVYPLTTLYVQHSCRPNTGVTYQQDKQNLVTLETIGVGDTISIGYVDLTLPRQERMDDLRLRFGPDYDCTCSRCLGEYTGLDTLLAQGQVGGPGYLRLEQASTVLEEDIKSWSILDTIQHSDHGNKETPTSLLPSEFSLAVSLALATQLDMDTDPSTTFAVFTNEQNGFDKATIRVVDSMMTTYNSVPAFTVNMIRAAEVQLRHALDQQKWVEAAKCATYLFVVYRLVYPPLHPVCAFHTVVLAKACWNSLIQLELAGLGNKLEKIYMHGVRTWIDVAKQSILYTFGQESGLWREMVDLQWVFERDQKLR